jgi:hypothetical protein
MDDISYKNDWNIGHFKPVASKKAASRQPDVLPSVPETGS